MNCKETEEVRRGRGRPSLPPEDRRTEKPQIKLTRLELDLIRSAAEASGEPVSRWARSVLLRAARRATSVGSG
jgi:uncharacterized protein (DUF1778 family)